MSIEETKKKGPDGGYACEGCNEYTSKQSPAVIQNENGHHYVTWYCVECDHENRIKFPMED